MIKDMYSKPRILLCSSGSVATVKVPKLTVKLIERGFEVKIVLTKSSLYFFDKCETYNGGDWKQFVELNGKDMIYQNEDEWVWSCMGDPVLHIELRKWADIILICPASADIMAKIVVGISDDLLLSVIRAWDQSKPKIICPAMNTLMWNHNITRSNVKSLVEEGWEIIDPISKLLACKDLGVGALADLDDIVEKVGNCCGQLNLTARENNLEMIPVLKKKTKSTYFEKYFSNSHELLSGIILGILISLLCQCLILFYSYLN